MFNNILLIILIFFINIINILLVFINIAYIKNRSKHFTSVCFSVYLFETQLLKNYFKII